MRDGLEKLQKFRCNGIPGVSEDEIVEKEISLGITLPPIIHKLYQFYSPDDPIFMARTKLIPLSHLELQKAEDETSVYSFISFLKGSNYYWGIIISNFNKSNFNKQDKSFVYYPTDNQACIFRSSLNKSKKFEGSIRTVSLVDWLIDNLSSLHLYSLPNIIALDYTEIPADKKMLFGSLFEPLGPPIADMFLSKSGTILMELLGICAPDSFPNDSYAFGAVSEQPLMHLISETGLDFLWFKRNGMIEYKPPEEKEPFVPHERELHSISPVLDFLRNFAGVDQPGCTEEDVQKAEKRFGAKLPLPVKEFYLKLPPEYMETNNCFRPLSRLRRRKDGKISFLVENQEVYYGAFAFDSPYFYQKLDDTGAKWEPVGILDGYLVSEFLWNLNAVPGLGFQSSEYPKFKPEMLEEGGELTQYFTDIAGISLKVGKENFMQLYQGFDGTVIGFYNKWTPSFRLLTRGEEHMSKAKELLGLNK